MQLLESVVSTFNFLCGENSNMAFFKDSVNSSQITILMYVEDNTKLMYPKNFNNISN